MSVTNEFHDLLLDVITGCHVWSCNHMPTHYSVISHFMMMIHLQNMNSSQYVRYTKDATCNDIIGKECDNIP